jgi:amino acid permease
MHLICKYIAVTILLEAYNLHSIYYTKPPHVKLKKQQRRTRNEKRKIKQKKGEKEKTREKIEKRESHVTERREEKMKRVKNKR